MLVDAYRWDTTVNTVRFYNKLNDEHLFPDNAAKMRNHLAIEVLNKDMLGLLHEYKCQVIKDCDYLKGLIELLQQTSKVISIFYDHRPIKTANDERLKDLMEFYKFLKAWETNATDNSQLMSQECRKDWTSTVLGFCSFVENILSDYPEAEIIPTLMNTDLLENTFGCQRGLVAGTGTNPTVMQYCKSINTITLSTNSISNKCNASCNSAAVPFNFNGEK